MVHFGTLDGADARGLTDQLCDLYAEVYAEPPYLEGPEHVARFAEHYSVEVVRDGFALASAVDNNLLVGAAYGWTMAAGQWFSSATSEPPKTILGTQKFAVMEWMVRRPYRGHGIGRRLLDTVLRDRAEPYAILASNPEAPARRIYERLGWRQCGTSKPDLLPPMDVLTLRLLP